MKIILSVIGIGSAFLAGQAHAQATAADRIPAGMTTVTLPAGTYAEFSYPLSGLGQGFCEIRDRIMPASNYREAPGRFFERYDEKFDPTKPQSAVGIFIPVRAKS